MIYIGSDHAGYEYKEELKHYFAERSVVFEDFGAFNADPSDYPGIAKRTAKAVVKSNGKGILLCGSGHGMCIAANRLHGIRAVNCFNTDSAKRARDEDDANILCLPTRLISKSEALEIVSVFLSTTFSHADRHRKRIKQIDEI